METVMLQRFNTAKPEEVNDRVFRFTISDESVDRYGTVIKMDGWDLTGYAKNGVVAYQHVTGSWDPDFILGKGRAWVENGKLMGEVEFEPEGTNRIADKVVKKLKFGSINATSVGFNPKTWSYGAERMGENPDVLYFRDHELLEWSIVNIPANANATVEKSLSDFVEMAASEKDPIEILKEETKKEAKADPYKDRFYALRFKCIQ